MGLVVPAAMGLLVLLHLEADETVLPPVIPPGVLDRPETHGGSLLVLVAHEGH